MSNGNKDPLTLSTDWPDSQKAPSEVPRGQGTEAKRISKKLAGFNAENSKAAQAIQLYYSTGIRQNELRSIAIIICQITKLQLDRDIDRNAQLLLKWFEDHWDVCAPLLPQIKLLDANFQPINLERELTKKA